VGSVFVASFQSISKRYFDTNDIFVVHGVAGWVGMLLTAGLARYVTTFLAKKAEACIIMLTLF
jgi:ammonia channel protein AmtB